MRAPKSSGLLNFKRFLTFIFELTVTTIEFIINKTSASLSINTPIRVSYKGSHLFFVNFHLQKAMYYLFVSIAGRYALR